MDQALAERWERHRSVIEANLQKWVRLDEGCPPRLAEAMEYSLMAGGKRLRPVLTLLACEACGGRFEAALPAACALEMVHTYSLVHDDLPAMDDDDFRRGRPTNHKVYGEALAILAGDALLTLAFEAVASVEPAAVAAACCADLARAAGACGMVGGQVADLAAESEPPSANPAAEFTKLRAIHRRKTAALITCGLTMGGRVAEAGQDTLSRLVTFGETVGLAFQITDDLLDIVGNQDKMGKAVQKDAAHGKLTYPGLLGVEQSRTLARQAVDEAIASVEPLGNSAHPLQSLARFVLTRDH